MCGRHGGRPSPIKVQGLRKGRRHDSGRWVVPCPANEVQRHECISKGLTLLPNLEIEQNQAQHPQRR